MFDFLKKKITGWIGKDAEESKEKPIKQEPAKKTKAVKEKPAKKVKETKKSSKQKIEKKPKDIEQQLKEKADEIESETPLEFNVGGLGYEPSQEKIEEAIEENQKEEKKKFSIWPFGKKKEKEEETEAPIKTEEEIPEEKEENFFSKLVKKISSSELSQEDFDEIFQELEITLLENNVALEAVDAIRDSLSKSLVGQQMKKTEAEKKIIDSLKESILNILIEPPNLIEQIKSHEGIYTILFFGINGTGKTTSIAKLAHKLKKEKISCVLAAGDTFRAASIEQLQTHADRIGVPIISSQYGSDPASVAFEAKKYASSHGIKVVLIDTAGRMYTKENLLKEMEKIVRVSKPDLKLFVGESITGNDAIDQARTFHETIGIDGIILSKADIDEKAGTILSVSHVTKKPIYFLGVGQEYGDLEVFSKKMVLKNLGLS